MRALLGLGLALLALGACATLSEDECRSGDWRAIGFRDGAAGRLESFIARHAEACAELGIRPDAAAWRAGRAEGLPLYCTPDNAFDLGRRGGALAPVCVGVDTRALARAHFEGRRLYELDRAIDEVEDELRFVDAAMEDLLEGKVTDEDRARLRRYRREEEFLRSRLRMLEFEQFRYSGYL